MPLLLHCARQFLGAIVPALLLIGLGVSVKAPEASAQEQPATAVIIDASGSMLAADAGGQTRMDAAKQATEGLLNELPQQQKLALLTYGTETGSGDEEKEAGCKDVRTLVPLGGERKAMVDEVKRLNPRGYTPIGASLLQAERELPTQGARQIVLVSDGIDTCAPPPVCEVAKEIKQRDVDVVINVIGLNVDAQARAELECIAKEGGGSYADAGDADSLKLQLVQKSTRTLNAGVISGEKVEGTPTGNDAPLIQAGGVVDGKPVPKHYQDVLPKQGEVHWKINVSEGERLMLSALVPPPPSSGEDIGAVMKAKIQATDTNGDLCFPDFTMGYDYQANSFETPLAPWGVTDPAAHDGESGKCEPGTYDVFIEREPGILNDRELPFEFMVWKIPAVENADTLAPASDQPTASGVEIGTPQGDLPYALGLDEAPTVQPGTYTTSIVPGEMQWLKVSVKEGQRLQVSAKNLPYQVEDPDSVTSGIGRKVHIAAFSPTLQPLGMGKVGAPSEDESEPVLEMEEDGGAEVATVSKPVRWKNIEQLDSGAFVSGEQYVGIRYDSFFREADQNTQSNPVGLEIVIGTQGDEETSPKFVDAPASTSDTATSESPATTGDDASRSMLMPIGIVAGIAALLALILVVIFRSYKRR